MRFESVVSSKLTIALSLKKSETANSKSFSLSKLDLNFSNPWCL